MVTSQRAGSKPQRAVGQADSRISTDNFRSNQLSDKRRELVDPRANDIALINYLRQLTFNRKTIGLQ
jgi:hypothetical protein